jgi:hypothetical protein
MKYRIITLFLSLAFATTVSAESFLSSLEYDAMLGFSLGGTAPVGLPSSIRHLNSYRPAPNFRLGAGAAHMFSSSWGISSALIVENKGMKTDARVEDYHMTMTRGGEQLEGRFWGDVETNVTEWMFTVPVQAAFKTGDFRFRLGPYVSLLFDKRFKGHAHDGYLRVGNPTGAKMIIGNDSETNGQYNFSSNMRSWQWGMDLGADWYVRRRLGIAADLSWGLSGVHKSSFKTIEQTLYPIYGTLALIYRIH